MKVTIIATVMLMAAYFLLLYGSVAFIQDKRFFSSAPKENLERIPDRKERFRDAHLIGWCIAVGALALFAGAFLFGAVDGVRSGRMGVHAFLKNSATQKRQDAVWHPAF